MTKIEWTHPPGYRGESWNPTTGCSHVSAGCDNCYAASFAHRGLSESHVGLTVRGQKGPLAGKIVFNGQVKLHEDRLDLPLRRRTPTCWFVDSMSDLFHERVPFEFIDQVMASIALCPQHRFIILTKRPMRMREYFDNPEYQVCDAISAACCKFNIPMKWSFDWHLRNLILGVSCEDQATADERIPPLLATRAATRCLSCEPLLGPIDLCHAGYPLMTGKYFGANDEYRRIHWVISGGESGKDARPSHPDWHRSLRDQCAAAGVAYFFKQWGEWWPRDPVYGDTDSFVKFECDGPNDRWCANEEIVLENNGSVPQRWKENGCGVVINQALYQPGPELNPWIMLKVGKRVAGRELDGRTHDDYPAALMDRVEAAS